jgi:ligand-binding sensor domain-containing protein/serine phosphatase RsbU (regulator of sigma subunit)
MIFLKKIQFLLTLLIFISARTFSQTYNFKNYNTEQGLPQSQVLCMFQDHKGFMWFGTNSGGVGKFDGNKFTNFSENEGLVNNVVYSITEHQNTKLLFGTMKGLSVFDGKKFKTYNEKQGLNNSYIFKLLQDGDKTWIGTMKGVFIFENDKITPFAADTLLNSSSVFAIFIDYKKNVWFGTIQNGLICYNVTTKKTTHFNTSNGLMENFVFSIAEDNKHQILIGTQKGLNIINDNFKIRNADEIPTNRNISFSAILRASNTDFYFGTQAEGLYRYDFKNKKTIARYDLLNGLTNNPIQCLYNDIEGNLWVGTDGAGVYKYTNDKFTYYTKSNGLAENYVNAVSQDRNGAYWIALRGKGLCKIEDKIMTQFQMNLKHNLNTIPDNDINAILPLEDGRVFFGTKEGLCIYENNSFKTITDYNFKEKYILSLYQDTQKTIWIGTSIGLYKYINGVITEEYQINQLKSSNQEFAIYSIIEDKIGSLWIGTAKGLIKLENGSITIFNEQNNFINSAVWSSAIDKNKDLWFGTGAGLFNYDYNNFTEISQKNGLSSNNVWSLKADNHNNLIIGLNTGLDILNLNDFGNKKINIKHLKKDDGLLSLENNYNASFKAKDGSILIGTIDGLEIYNPKFDIPNKHEAITSISNVKLFFGQEDILKYAHGIDSTTLLPKDLTLPFNKNHLTFQFIGISLTAPEKVMYQYKLEGLDDDWTPPTSKTEGTYSSLQPGNYTFMIKAMNNDGLWNTEYKTFKFTISPPWYKTWWFYSICIILTISGFALYNYIHTQKLIADKQKLEVLVTERTKELREEKEKVEIINKEVIEQKTVIEHHNIEIMDSIKYAKNIQEALLPSLADVNTLFKNCFVLYMPKDIVSGDFYWFAKNGDHRFIAAVDCTGHGVPGAFMSIVGNTLLNEIVNEKKITVPGDILLELHKGVKIALNQNAKEFERRDGMDIALCAFNQNTNEIQYAGANRPLWIYRKNKNYELENIKATKFPIGGLELEETRVYQNHVIKLDEGDCIYIFSDGYADQFGGPKGKKFMVTNLQKTLFENTKNSMDTQKENLTIAFNEWKSDAEQIDDVLVIGIKI